MIDSKLLDCERELFFLQTQGGVYFPILGAIFWTSLGVAGYFLSPQTWCFAVLCLIAVVLPIGIALFRRLVKKLLLKSPLASLILPALVPVCLSFAITVPAYFTDISLVPLTLVLGLTFHWPVVGWLYNQPVFIIHSLVRTTVAVFMWSFFPEHIFTLLPILIGLLYLITAWWLLRKLHQLKSTMTNP
jgi:hypothetical protein